MPRPHKCQILKEQPFLSSLPLSPFHRQSFRPFFVYAFPIGAPRSQTLEKIIYQASRSHLSGCFFFPPTAARGLCTLVPRVFSVRTNRFRFNFFSALLGAQSGVSGHPNLRVHVVLYNRIASKTARRAGRGRMQASRHKFSLPGAPPGDNSGGGNCHGFPWRFASRKP